METIFIGQKDAKELLHYSKAKNAFVAEASEIEYEFHVAVRHIDKIKVKSPKTGAIKFFKPTSVTRDERENEIVCWNFTADDGMAIHIYND